MPAFEITAIEQTKRSYEVVASTLAKAVQLFEDMNDRQKEQAEIFADDTKDKEWLVTSAVVVTTSTQD